MSDETTSAAIARSGENALVGCLWGGAAGDAVGLPAEGLTARRQARLFGGTICEHRLLRGRGMVSDDTEHAVLTADALIASGGEPRAFSRHLARGLLRWFWSLPPGVGWATLRACGRLAVGVAPEQSGVWSAGNGPAMRATVIGAFCAYRFGPERDDDLRALVHMATRITHTDAKAEWGALAVACAARLSALRRMTGPALLADLARCLPPNDADAQELFSLVTRAADSASGGETTVDFARDALGLRDRVGGYMYHTVPAALHAALRYPNDLRAAVEGVIACGGDTDTTGAITGGIVGAGVGLDGVPASWRAGLRDWPVSAARIEETGARLARVAATATPEATTAPLLVLLWLRNQFFLCVVLYHGLRRLLPPY